MSINLDDNKNNYFPALGLNTTLDEIQSAINTISGNAPSTDKFIYIESKSDLPDAVGGVITLLANATYYFIGTIDLAGDRLEGSENTCLLGPSSENAFITSTGLGVGIPLFSTEWTTAIRHITINDVDTGIYINGNINPPVALDWTGVNFNDVSNVGTINTCDNFIFTKGSFLSSQNLLITGTAGTIGIDNSLLRADASSTDFIINIDEDAIITRRFRIIYTSIVASGTSKGIFASPTASINTESYILDTVNFSGGSTYLDGISTTSNETLFVNCINIDNTSVNGQLYMTSNATASVIATQSFWVKVAGNTIPSIDNEKYTTSNNRLTNDAKIERKYLIQAHLSFNSGNGNVCEFGFYDSKLGAIRTPSRAKSTANAAGRAENITLGCVVNHSQGDYIEVWCQNTSSATNITVSELNLLITQII
jgi:hypothetical protein